MTQAKMWKAGLASVMLAFVFGGSGAKAAKEVDGVLELTFAAYWPGTVAWADIEHAYFAAIEERSGGRLKVTKKHWKGLFGAAELQGAVRDGAIDMAWSSPLYTPADNPIRTLLIGGPFLGKYIDVPGLVYTHLYDTWEPAKEDFHKHSVVPLYIRPSPAMGLALKGEFNSPDDLVGKKVRSHGKVFSKGLKNMGAIPVLVESADVEQQLRAGNLDGTTELGGLTWAKLGTNIPGLKLVDSRIGPYGSGHMIMNKEVFDSLPADLQKMPSDMRYEWTLLCTRWAAIDAQKAAALIEKENIPFLRFTDEQFDDWMVKMKIDDEIEALIEENEANGVPAREAVRRFKEVAAILDKTSIYNTTTAFPTVGPHIFPITYSD